jgi:hypothetical protein
MRIIAFLLTISLCPLVAQSDRATLTGTVADQSHAIIPRYRP